LNPPIELGYQLTHFYQNHRRFSLSRIDDQLRGDYVDFDGMSNCRPHRSKDDSSDPADWYLPCGIFALSVFSDKFVWADSDIFRDDTIAYDSEIQWLFRNLSSEYETGIRWLDELFPNGTRNPHFISWMRTSFLGTVSKVYARSENTAVREGQYEVLIENRYREDRFGGEKFLTLAEVSPFGKKNPFLGIAYMAVGGLCIASALMVILSELIIPRRLGEEP
jgi:hypothetical protein